MTSIKSTLVSDIQFRKMFKFTEKGSIFAGIQVSQSFQYKLPWREIRPEYGTVVNLKQLLIIYHNIEVRRLEFYPKAIFVDKIKIKNVYEENLCFKNIIYVIKELAEKSVSQDVNRIINYATNKPDSVYDFHPKRHVLPSDLQNKMPQEMFYKFCEKYQNSRKSIANDASSKEILEKLSGFPEITIFMDYLDQNFESGVVLPLKHYEKLNRYKNNTDSLAPYFFSKSIYENDSKSHFISGNDSMADYLSGKKISIIVMKAFVQSQGITMSSKPSLSFFIKNLVTMLFKKCVVYTRKNHKFPMIQIQSKLFNKFCGIFLSWLFNTESKSSFKFKLYTETRPVDKISVSKFKWSNENEFCTYMEHNCISFVDDLNTDYGFHAITDIFSDDNLFLKPHAPYVVDFDKNAESDHGLACRNFNFEDNNKNSEIANVVNFYEKRQFLFDPKNYEHQKYVLYGKNSSHIAAINKIESTPTKFSAVAARRFLAEVVLPLILQLYEGLDDANNPTKSWSCSFDRLFSFEVGLPGTVFELKNMLALRQKKSDCPISVPTENLEKFVQEQSLKFKLFLKRIEMVILLNDNPTYALIGIDFRSRFYILGVLSITHCFWLRYLVILLPDNRNFIQNQWTSLLISYDATYKEILYNSEEHKYKTIEQYKSFTLRTLEVNKKQIGRGWLSCFFAIILVEQYNAAIPSIFDATSSAIQMVALISNAKQLLDSTNLFGGTQKDPYFASLPQTLNYVFPYKNTNRKHYLTKKRVIKFNTTDIPRDILKMLLIRTTYGSKAHIIAYDLLNKKEIQKLSIKKLPVFNNIRTATALVNAVVEGFETKNENVFEKLTFFLQEQVRSNDYIYKHHFPNQLTTICMYFSKQITRVKFQLPSNRIISKKNKIADFTDTQNVNSNCKKTRQVEVENPTLSKDKNKVLISSVANFCHTLDSFIMSETVLGYSGFILPIHDAFIIGDNRKDFLVKSYANSCAVSQNIIWDSLGKQLKNNGFTPPDSVSQEIIKSSQYAIKIVQLVICRKFSV